MFKPLGLMLRSFLLNSGCKTKEEKEYHDVLFAKNHFEGLLSLILYMKKFLHFDWLRAVQFFSKKVQKRVNSVQKEETNQAF